MAHVEFDWVAKKPFQAEHPLGSGTVVTYAPGDRVPANDWGQAAHHMEGNDTITRIAINVADPGDDVAGARPASPPPYGLTDPTRQYLAYEGKAPISLEEPKLEAPEDEEPPEQEIKYPNHLGGGTYELSDGMHVRGKRRAVSAQAALDKG
jgi:hypothetical protein